MFISDDGSRILLVVNHITLWVWEHCPGAVNPVKSNPVAPPSTTSSNTKQDNFTTGNDDKWSSVTFGENSKFKTFSSKETVVDAVFSSNEVCTLLDIMNEVVVHTEKDMAKH